ncbi:MAG: hypothetical protein ACLR3R_18660 [Clostridium paraputrificum]
MEREVFLNLSISEQVDYFNTKMENGLSLTKVAKEIGISKSISEKFKKHGYNLINGKLIESRNITNKDISSEKNRL